MKAAYLLKVMGTVALLAYANGAHAVITCSVSSPGFVTNYDTTAVAQTIVQSNFTVQCSRSAAGDPTAVTYTVGADNGLYASGGGNRANFGTSFVTYDTYTTSACATKWKSATANLLPKPDGTLTLTTVGQSYSATTNYWACIPAAQAGVTTGTHTDTVTMTLDASWGAGPSNKTTVTGTVSASILANATCSISTAPGPVALTYTSFGGIANASTTFAATCTNGLPYTMALDAAGGTVLGLNYTIALSATSATGNGLAQTHSINGSIAGGQSGTCATASCNATAPHTLTITY